MILVDERVGSRELLSTLRGFGVDAELTLLESADFQFTGKLDGEPVLVGVERKTIQDLCNSMRDGRLAGVQIGKMQQTFDVSFLVVEGYWRRGRGTGLLETKNGVGWHAIRGNHRYSEVTRFLASLRELGGLRVWRTGDEEETAAFVAEEYTWWQKEKHTTNATIYAPEPVRVRRGHRASSFRTEVTLLEKWLAQLPGVDARATELSQYFSSARDMADSEVERWCCIKGIGKKSAGKIVEAINGTSG